MWPSPVGGKRHGPAPAQLHGGQGLEPAQQRRERSLSWPQGTKGMWPSPIQPRRRCIAQPHSVARGWGRGHDLWPQPATQCLGFGIWQLERVAVFIAPVPLPPHFPIHVSPAGWIPMALQVAFGPQAADSTPVLVCADHSQGSAQEGDRCYPERKCKSPEKTAACALSHYHFRRER